MITFSITRFTGGIYVEADSISTVVKGSTIAHKSTIHLMEKFVTSQSATEKFHLMPITNERQKVVVHFTCLLDHSDGIIFYLLYDDESNAEFN